MTLKSLCLLSTASLSVLTMAAPAIVRAQEATVSFALPAGPMKTSLLTVATQSNIKILFDIATVSSLQAPALQGRYTPRQGNPPVRAAFR
jgi:iron complex outermembrane receptor protein